jgi:hypothetical protein
MRSLKYYEKQAEFYMRLYALSASSELQKPLIHCYLVVEFPVTLMLSRRVSPECFEVKEQIDQRI